uniref:Uncharacterized protein n=1 Tax=Anguilla anguilla TaxID=7936 RepID=A0A0E9PI10_ANGAN
MHVLGNLRHKVDSISVIILNFSQDSVQDLHNLMLYRVRTFYININNASTLQ